MTEFLKKEKKKKRQVGNGIISTATRWWVTEYPNAPVLQTDVWQAAWLVLRGKRLQAKL